jgi:hypothetical protein
VTEDDPLDPDIVSLLVDPPLSVALSDCVFWVSVVLDAACDCCASYAASPATPATPTATIPTVAWVNRRAPRARTLGGRCADVIPTVGHGGLNAS